MRFRSPLYVLACVVLILIAAFLNVNWPINARAQEQKPATALLDEKQILHHLNSVITWYRKTKTQIQPVGLPTDTLYQSTANKIAIQVVNLAFASAEKAAPLLPSETEQSATGSSRQNLLRILQETTAHNAQLQTEIAQLNNKIASAPRRNLQTLIDQRDRVQGELDLGNSMLNSLNQLTRASDQKTTKAKSPSGNQPNPNGFEASVAQLKITLPEIFETKNQPAAPSAPVQNVSSPTGLFGELHRLYDQSVSLRNSKALRFRRPNSRTSSTASDRLYAPR